MTDASPDNLDGHWSVRGWNNLPRISYQISMQQNDGERQKTLQGKDNFKYPGENRKTILKLLLQEKCRGSNPGGGQEIFSSPRPSRPALWTTQPAGNYFWGYSGRGVTLTTHLHLEPRLKMSISIPPLPLCACVAGYEHLFTFTSTYGGWKGVGEVE